LAWLIHDGQVIASVEKDKRGKYSLLRSCFGKLKDINGVLMIENAIFIHNIGAPVKVNIIFLDNNLSVVKLRSLGRNRAVFVGHKVKYILVGMPKTLLKDNIHLGDALSIAVDDT